MVVPIVEDTRRVLEYYLRTGTGDYIFPIMSGRLTPEEVYTRIRARNSAMSKMLGRIRKRIGLTKNLTFHLARHSFANKLLVEGWSIFEIRDMLGHNTVTTTEQYLSGFDAYALSERYRQGR